MMYRSMIILLSVGFLLANCTSDNQVLNNTDLVFTNSYRLPVPAYTYKGVNGKDYKVTGDTNYFSGIPDTLNANPVFRWDTFNIKIMCCAIFLKPIHVQNGIITNSKDMIWQWHSGMINGKEGNVQYSDGRNVKNGVIDYENQPATLASDNYFWAVWGWNSSATDVLYSSRQMQFYVSK